MDWISIGASVVAFLALLASVFSAAGAARSADVATSAERRAAKQANTQAAREVARTEGQIQLLGRMVDLVMQRAGSTAKACAACYESNLSFARAQAEIHERRQQANALLGTVGETPPGLDDDALHARQLELDRILSQFSAHMHWADRRDAELSKTNDHLIDGLLAEERARGVWPRRAPDGRIRTD